MTLSSLLETAVLAVADSCAVARAVQRARSGGAGPSALAKSDTSPVTVADFAVQAIVASRLERQLGRGRLRLVGEESASALRDPAAAATCDAVVEAVRSVDASMTCDDVMQAIDLGGFAGEGAGPDDDGFWTIDPIDGTKGFVRDQQYAICLARIRRGEVVAAVLGCPNLGPAGAPTGDHPARGVIFVAERGGGCWQRDEATPAGPGTRVRRRPIDPSAELVLAGSVEGESSLHQRKRSILDGAGVRTRAVQLDGQGKYGLVARGDADIYLRLPRRTLLVESIWDHASGSLCVSEAGGSVTDVDGRTLDFGRGRSLAGNRGILACAAELHDRLLASASTVELDPTRG